MKNLLLAIALCLLAVSCASAGNQPASQLPQTLSLQPTDTLIVSTGIVAHSTRSITASNLLESLKGFSDWPVGGGGGGTNGLTSQQITNAAQTVVTQAVSSAAYHPASDFYSSGNPNGYQTAGQVSSAVSAGIASQPLNSLTQNGIVPAGTNHPSQFYMTGPDGTPGWNTFTPGAPLWNLVGSGVNSSAGMTNDTGAVLTYRNGGIIHASSADAVNASQVIGGGTGGTIPFNALPSNIITQSQGGVMFRASTAPFVFTNEFLGMAFPLSIGSGLYGPTLSADASQSTLSAANMTANEFYGDGANLTLRATYNTVFIDATNGNDAWSGLEPNHPVKTVAQAAIIANGTNWIWRFAPGQVYDVWTNTPIVLNGAELFLDGSTIQSTNWVQNITGQMLFAVTASTKFHGGQLKMWNSVGTANQYPIYIIATNTSGVPLDLVLDRVTVTNYSDCIYDVNLSSASQTLRIWAYGCSFSSGFDCFNINQAAQPSSSRFYFEGCRFSSSYPGGGTLRGGVCGAGTWLFNGCSIDLWDGTGGSGFSGGLVLSNSANVYLSGTTISVNTTNKPATCYKVIAGSGTCYIAGHPFSDNDVTPAANIVWVGGPTNAPISGAFLAPDGNGNWRWSLDAGGQTNLNASALASGTVPEARLSANVPLLNANNNFTGQTNTFQTVVANSIINLSTNPTSTFGNGVFTGYVSVGSALYTGKTNAALLGTDGNGALQTVTLGTGLSMAGTTLNASGSGGGYTVDISGIASNATSEVSVYTNSHLMTATNSLFLESWVDMDGATNYLAKHWDSYFRDQAFIGSNTITSFASATNLTARWALLNSTGLVLYVKGYTNESINYTARAIERAWQTNGVVTTGGGGGAPCGNSLFFTSDSELAYVPIGDNSTEYYVSAIWTNTVNQTFCRIDFLIGKDTGTIAGKTFNAVLSSDGGYSSLGTIIATSQPVSGSDAWASTWVSFTFASPVSVSANTSYHVSLTANGVDASNFAHCLRGGSVANVYGWGGFTSTGTQSYFTTGETICFKIYQ